MAFWSTSTGGEPLRQYRWFMSFGGAAAPAAGNVDLANVGFALKKVEKPKAKINTIQHKYMNHFFNYPGRLEWEDINVTFAAITDPTISNYLVNILKAGGYGVPPGTSAVQDKSSMGKQKFNNALGTELAIKQVDADGNVIETWTLYRAFFTSVQFGSLDYGSEEIVEISCGIKYDWATLAAMAGMESAVGVAPATPKG